MKYLMSLLMMSIVTGICAQPFSFPEQTIRSYECQDCPQLSKEPLSAHWALPDLPLFNKTLTAQDSYSWQQWISGKALKEGVTISTLAENAIIRLTPAEPLKIPENWQMKIQFHTPQGGVKSLQEIGLHSDANALPINQQAAQKSLVVQLNKSAGYGKFKLQIPEGVIPAETRWQLSVYDKYASMHLHVETDKAQYRYGDWLKATIYLHDDSRFNPVEYIEAFVDAPSGKTYQMNLREVRPDVYQGVLQLSDTQITQGENWNLEVLCHQHRGDQIIIRTAHTIFSYIVPSARVISLEANKVEPLHYKVNIEAEQSSRYTFQAILYGYDQNGTLKPGQISQSSYWFEKGRHSFPFSFNKTAMKGLQPPYSIGQVKLLDLTQLKPVFYYEPLIKVDEIS